LILDSSKIPFELLREVLDKEPIPGNMINQKLLFKHLFKLHTIEKDFYIFTRTSKERLVLCKELKRALKLTKKSIISLRGSSIRSASIKSELKSQKKERSIAYLDFQDYKSSTMFVTENQVNG
jgi:hypothetical protein